MTNEPTNPTPRIGRPPRDFDRAAAAKMIAEGATAPATAEAFDVSEQTIQRMIRKLGGIEALRERRRVSMDPARLAEMRDMREKKMTLKAIGKHFGVSRAAVCEALNRPRIPAPRPAPRDPPPSS